MGQKRVTVFKLSLSRIPVCWTFSYVQRLDVVAGWKAYLPAVTNLIISFAYFNLVDPCMVLFSIFRVSNVCPCVQRRTLSRDETIVLESQIFPWQVYKVVIRMLLSLTISPEEDPLATRKRLQLIMLLIVSITLLIAALAVPPCLIATIKVSSKFGALGERFHEERIWLQVLKTPREENNAVRELHRVRRRA